LGKYCRRRNSLPRRDAQRSKVRRRISSDIDRAGLVARALLRSGRTPTEVLAMQINSSAQSAVHRHEPNLSPAKAARSALENRSDLEDQPFGRLVSLIARGKPLPPSQSSYPSGEDRGD
jgi:hypothetical protein